MKSAYDIIKKPVLTEKSYDQFPARTYTFEVEKTANKIEIKRAVEEVFDVHVTGVNIIKVPGKMRRMGKTAGMTRTWKKAVVTLADGERIDLFQGV